MSDNGRTHFADDATLEHIANLERQLSEAHGWLKHYEKAEPLKYRHLRTENDRLQAEIERLKAERDELAMKAGFMLEYVDKINPPTGPFWSGALIQEALRQDIAKVQK